MWPSVSDFFTSHDVLKACHCWNMYQSVPPSCSGHIIFHCMVNTSWLTPEFTLGPYSTLSRFLGVGCELRAWVFSAHRCPAAQRHLLESLPLPPLRKSSRQSLPTSFFFLKIVSAALVLWLPYKIYDQLVYMYKCILLDFHWNCYRAKDQFQDIPYDAESSRPWTRHALLLTISLPACMGVLQFSA